MVPEGPTEGCQFTIPSGLIGTRLEAAGIIIHTYPGRYMFTSDV